MLRPNKIVFGATVFGRLVVGRFFGSVLVVELHTGRERVVRLRWDISSIRFFFPFFLLTFFLFRGRLRRTEAEYIPVPGSMETLEHGEHNIARCV